MGPNGAGKSTLLRAWIGFERPTIGSTRVLHIDPIRNPAKAIERVGYLAQSIALYRGLSIIAHIEFAESLRRTFDRHVTLDRLGQLDIPLDKRAGELSGGEQAHVALALALGTRAPVLLLDEPLASLDPLARYEFLRVLVNDVRARNATAVLSSHIVSDVDTACDSIIVLGQGTVKLHAPIREAIATHRLAKTNSGHQNVVASIRHRDADQAILVRSTDSALPQPTLEELVLGYLVASKAQLPPK